MPLKLAHTFEKLIDDTINELPVDPEISAHENAAFEFGSEFTALRAQRNSFFADRMNAGVPHASSGNADSVPFASRCRARNNGVLRTRQRVKVCSVLPA